LTGRPQDLDRGAWADDPCVVEIGQVLVAGDEQVGRRAEQGDEVIVVAVTRRGGNCVGFATEVARRAIAST